MASNLPASKSGLYADPREDWLALHQEKIIDPARPIVDPHHHLWDRPARLIPTDPRPEHGFDNIVRMVPRYLLDQLMAGEVSGTPNAANPTKHWDEVYVSRYYNWKSGAYHNGYVHVSVYKFKADAPDDALDLLSQHMVVPVLEKLLAEGSIVEYEIDTQAIHTSAPGTFLIIYVTPTPEGLDTVNAATRANQKEHPLGVDAFGSFVDDSGHRDELLKGNGVFK